MSFPDNDGQSSVRAAHAHSLTTWTRFRRYAGRRRGQLRPTVIHSTRFGRQYEHDRKADQVSARPRRRLVEAAAMSSATADKAP